MEGAMIKKKIFLLSVLVLASNILAFQTNALAETIWGRVFNVDTNNQRLSIMKKDITDGRIEYFNILIQPETQYNGIVSLDSLKIGDVVKVETVRDAASGKWEAKLLEVREISHDKQNNNQNNQINIRKQNLNGNIQEADKYIPQASFSF